MAYQRRMDWRNETSECWRETTDDRHVIIQLLDRLHAAGYGHGDLELRHIVRKLDEQQTSVDHQWLFIDLEHSFKITAANTEAAVSEKAILRQLLQVDDIPSS